MIGNPTEEDKKSSNSEDDNTNNKSDMTAFVSHLPLFIFGYLTAVCTYGIHSELKKINNLNSSPSTSSFRPRRTKKEEPGFKNGVKRILKQNRNFLESYILPDHLQRHHKD